MEVMKSNADEERKVSGYRNAITRAYPMERRGYIYVLATSYQDRSGQQIIKIGRTGRSPTARVQELSRGGPQGMILVGAVSCRDMVELEKRAHQQFNYSRYMSDGGTEYFTANPNDVLKWLRSATPRLNLDSARKDAWDEYCQSKPFKTNSRFTIAFIAIPVIFSPLAGILIQPYHIWYVFIGPAVYFFLAITFGKHVQSLGYVKKLNAEMESVQRELEIKYNLPVGGVKATPITE